MSSPQKPSPLDWLSFPTPAVVDAPHPDLFEFELDNSLSTFDQTQVQLLTLDYNDSFAFFRSDTPHGPPSAITVSSESAYETLSSRSESIYNYPHSPSYPAGIESQFAADLPLDFGKFAIYADTLSNNGLSISMDPSRDASAYRGLPYDPKGVFDNNASYDIPTAGGSSSSLYPGATANYLPAQSTVAPSNISNGQGRAPTDSPVSSSDGSLMRTPDPDPRKKYPCPSCTRSFARAYNLKTHLATHDPNRLKPYVCTHRSCGRSFSRKHDLGRHLVSIHRDETGHQYTSGSVHSETEPSRKPVGIAADKAREWCDDCGRGWTGRHRTCSCRDVK